MPAGEPTWPGPPDPTLHTCCCPSSCSRCSARATRSPTRRSMRYASLPCGTAAVQQRCRAGAAQVRKGCREAAAPGTAAGGAAAAAAAAHLWRRGQVVTPHVHRNHLEVLPQRRHLMAPAEPSLREAVDEQEEREAGGGGGAGASHVQPERSGRGAGWEGAERRAAEVEAAGRMGRGGSAHLIPGSVSTKWWASPGSGSGRCSWLRSGRRSSTERGLQGKRVEAQRLAAHSLLPLPPPLRRTSTGTEAPA